MDKHVEPAARELEPSDIAAPVDGGLTGLDLETLDDSGGASVVIVEFDEAMERPRAFHAVPNWLAQRFGREEILSANPHEGVALYCRSCDLLLNGARTGGACPICGESDRDRVLYLMADPDSDGCGSSGDQEIGE